MNLKQTTPFALFCQISSGDKRKGGRVTTTRLPRPLNRPTPLKPVHHGRHSHPKTRFRSSDAHCSCRHSDSEKSRATWHPQKRGLVGKRTWSTNSSDRRANSSQSAWTPLPRPTTILQSAIS